MPTKKLGPSPSFSLRIPSGNRHEVEEKKPTEKANRKSQPKKPTEKAKRFRKTDWKQWCLGNR
eukprot:503804-Rhodomonas_salina.1